MSLVIFNPELYANLPQFVTVTIRDELNRELLSKNILDQLLYHLAVLATYVTEDSIYIDPVEDYIDDIVVDDYLTSMLRRFISLIFYKIELLGGYFSNPETTYRLFPYVFQYLNNGLFVYKKIPYNCIALYQTCNVV